jgi:hypothetical protein
LTTTNNNLFRFNNLLSIKGEKRIKPSYKVLAITLKGEFWVISKLEIKIETTRFERIEED